MPRTGLWVASAVVVVSNLCALGLAGINRQGQPDAVVELTERELRLAPREMENTAMMLRLAWTDPNGAREAGWFDRAKLTELGFDCRLRPTSENVAHYRAMPPRPAFAALEYDGPAWQRYVATLPAGAEATSIGERSRLVLVDVARDAAPLRTRHPDRDRVVVVPAIVSLTFVQENGHAPLLKGRMEVLAPELNVPRGLRRALEQIATGPRQPGEPTGRTASPLGHEPRYRVTVAWGRRHTPWIEGIRPVEGPR